MNSSGADKNYTDKELAVKAQNGDLDAEEALMRRYKETVKIKSHYYYMAGADEDDVVQEGMIGLLKAIRQYDEEKEASFSTFAGICITRQIINAIRTADREKHKALNTSVSLNKPMDRSRQTGKEYEDITLADTLKAEAVESPEAFLVIKDVVYYILHNGDNIFSEFEMQVLNEIIKENDYNKIMKKLGKNYKSIDNAMQRIKKKIINYLWQ
ncbi:MAG: sigma-70 family RNA polymerase sigma factor [Anaerovoracaceae bacterium]